LHSGSTTAPPSRFVEKAMRSFFGFFLMARDTGRALGGGVGIADLRTGSNIKRRGGVSHTAAHYVLGDEAAEAIAEDGPERIASARQLEADDAAA
jgi:hypothetical protein